MIAKNGKKVSFISNFTPLDQLENTNYLMKQDPNTGEFYLQEQDKFTLPEKIYGDSAKLSKRYLNTFKNTDKNLGVLLKGLKGTGKSLLAKRICIESGLPVIILTSAFGGTEFNDFLSNIKQEVVVFIDEFEKIYTNSRDFFASSKNDIGNQSMLLTLLDGVFTSKKLFVLTANESTLHDALTNRPGRIHYLKEYGPLSNDIIREVANDLLENKSHVEQIVEISNIIGDVNMDAVVTLIEECNLYSEEPREAVNYLNIKPENSKFEVIWKDDQYKGYEFTGVINQHPLLQLGKSSIDAEGFFVGTNKKLKLDYTPYSSLRFRTATKPEVVINDDGTMTVTDDRKTKVLIKKAKRSSFTF